MSWPFEIREEKLTINLAAGNQALIKIEENEPPYRFYGFDGNYVSDGASTKTFTLGVVAPGGAPEFRFMRRVNVGTTDMDFWWKDLNLGAEGQSSQRDALLPYLDVPPGGTIRVNSTVAVDGGEFMGTMVGHQLTKNWAARVFLATDPETVNFGPRGQFSLTKLRPNLAAQGGGLTAI